MTEALFDLIGKSVLQGGCDVGRMLRASSIPAARVAESFAALSENLSGDYCAIHHSHFDHMIDG